ncbi:MAG: site-specific DNA-methyltransferase [Elusimicrobia bacterium CG08_land_8_20_14_0_20_44_26]|nr:MAG: site-specific DNA-methyltransferase [Elusimicrobia bacterium CG08_land_8_20_14_0_20_44_26]
MKLQPEQFELETTTVWSFPKRGNWATHSGKFRGNFAPQIPRNLILRYSKEGDTVMDPMAGGGTTLIECRLTGRNSIGIDINSDIAKIARNAMHFRRPDNVPKSTYSIRIGDARKLKGIKDESIDLVIIHPPYADIIKYSNGKIEGDLSNIHFIDKFCDEMDKVISECFRVLKPEKYCAILIGDTRRQKYYVPIAYQVMQRFLKAGFKLKEDIIKQQWNCKTTSYWAEKSKQYNFFMIMHEHLFIFHKF